MADDYPEIESALRRLAFYRLEPDAPLPARDAAAAEAAATGFALPDDYAWFCSAHGAGAFDRHAMLPLPPGCPLGPEFRLDIVYAVGAGEDWDRWRWRAIRTSTGCLPASFRSAPTRAAISSCSARRTGLASTPGITRHRELADGELDRRIEDLRGAGIDVQQLDIDQLLLLWEQMFPDRVANPTGHGNLYGIAGSFSDACAALRVAG